MVHRHGTPLKMFKKIPQKFHDKAVQSNILWQNINKINEISILQLADKQGNPSFQFHAPGSERRYPCTEKQHQLSQNISPVCFSFLRVIASDKHLESECGKRAKNVEFDTAKKISRYKQHFFAILRRILINSSPTYLP